ncbi:MAG: spore coat protein [Clostridia bacterium]|nr:spore coat protein [Clostridia bacterium]
MREYKADITLNEEDSLFDLLTAEKTLVKLYALVLTECVSKGAREVVQKNLGEQIDDQIKVFFLNTELDHARVCSAEEKDVMKAKEEFSVKAKKLKKE